MMGQLVKCHKCRVKRHAFIKECDCQSGVLTVNISDVSKEQLYSLMNEAFDGTGVLKVIFPSGTTWLCSTDWKGGATWWELKEGRTFARTNEGWEEILCDGRVVRGEGFVDRNKDYDTPENHTRGIV